MALPHGATLPGQRLRLGPGGIAVAAPSVSGRPASRGRTQQTAVRTGGSNAVLDLVDSTTGRSQVRHASAGNGRELAAEGGVFSSMCRNYLLAPFRDASQLNACSVRHSLRTGGNINGYCTSGMVHLLGAVLLQCRDGRLSCQAEDEWFNLLVSGGANFDLPFDSEGQVFYPLGFALRYRVARAGALLLVHGATVIDHVSVVDHRCTAQLLDFVDPARAMDSHEQAPRGPGRQRRLSRGGYPASRNGTAGPLVARRPPAAAGGLSAATLAAGTGALPERGGLRRGQPQSPEGAHRRLEPALARQARAAVLRRCRAPIVHLAAAACGGYAEPAQQPAEGIESHVIADPGIFGHLLPYL